MKKIYLTTGTYEYMYRLWQKQKKRKLIFMHNEEHALLLDESRKKSIFAAPRTYEIIDERGELGDTGFAHFYYYPVLIEERQFFEHHLLKAAHRFNFTNGFIAYRFLRPVKRNSYLFFTMWESEEAFRLWKKDQSLTSLFQIPDAKLKKMPEPFPEPAYEVFYLVGEKEDEGKEFWADGHLR